MQQIDRKEELRIAGLKKVGLLAMSIVMTTEEFSLFFIAKTHEVILLILVLCAVYTVAHWAKWKCTRLVLCVECFKEMIESF